DLLAFIQGIAQKPKEIHLIHGEEEAKQSLLRAMRF
ncbi:TPA: metallo-beta-lactamase, partial [Vibrio vulnificus]|nr:metallo-beta-lactamase [Vibrio vulnificus]